jgi:L-rhamnose-H+ transport protein
MNPLIPGFGLIFLAALSGGAFAVPLKLRRRFEWENTWIAGFFFALIVFPFVSVAIFLPEWSGAIAAAGTTTVVIALAFGFLWGWGSITFAMGISAVGLSIGYATIMGVATAFGSVIPMVRRWEAIPGAARSAVIAGIAICILGVVICGRAAFIRERAVDSTGKNSGKLAVRALLIGLAWCLLSGFLSACVNLGFDFANRIADEARHLGAGPLSSTIAPWLPVYWGGYVAVLIGAGSTMFRKRSWDRFTGPGAPRDFALAALLGLCNFMAQIPYGIGAHYLGTLGTSVGWGVNISASLLIANGFGFLTGEWKGAPKSAVTTLGGGLAVLILGMVVLAYGNTLATH